MMTSMISGYDSHTKDTAFTIGLQGISMEKADEIENVVLETLEKVVKNGEPSCIVPGCKFQCKSDKYTYPLPESKEIWPRFTDLVTWAFVRNLVIFSTSEPDDFDPVTAGAAEPPACAVEALCSRLSAAGAHPAPELACTAAEAPDAAPPSSTDGECEALQPCAPQITMCMVAT